MLAPLLAALLLAAAPSQPLLVFHGNTVLTDDVYRSVLDLPQSTTATSANARSVSARLRTFLRKSGYELATVRARVSGDQLNIEIDEGRLDKIVIVGGGVFETLRAKLELSLPGNVFNRPLLERELRRIAERFHFADFAYELVPVRSVTVTPGPQLDEVGALQELPFFQPESSQELHVFIASGPWGRGLSPQLAIDSLQGGGLGLQYHNGGLLLRDDRWLTEGLVALAQRERLDIPSTYLVLSRLTGGAHYFGPALGERVRPELGVRADLLDRQRSDLGLESFRYFRLDSSLDAQIVAGRGLTFTAGLGFERRILFDLQSAAPLIPLVANSPRAQSRGHGDLTMRLVLTPGELRRDRREQLDLGLRVYLRAAPDRPNTVAVRGRYQRVFMMGWNELWVEGLASVLAGDVLFPDEEPVGGDALRGPFSDEAARKLGAIDIEFRYSLWRDVFKLGFFHNTAVFGHINRTDDTETPRVADSFGLGIHALIIDQFQLDSWFGFGFASDGRFSHGAALAIRQAF